MIKNKTINKRNLIEMQLKNLYYFSLIKTAKLLLILKTNEKN